MLRNPLPLQGAIWKMAFSLWNTVGSHIWLKKEERVYYCVVCIVLADGLAPLGARTSAGTAMTKVVSRVDTALEMIWGVKTFRALL